MLHQFPLNGSGESSKNCGDSTEVTFWVCLSRDISTTDVYICTIITYALNTACVMMIKRSDVFIRDGTIYLRHNAIVTSSVDNK